jgi:thiamine monophosphate synthase
MNLPRLYAILHTESLAGRGVAIGFSSHTADQLSPAGAWPVDYVAIGGITLDNALDAIRAGATMDSEAVTTYGLAEDRVFRFAALGLGRRANPQLRVSRV